MRDVTPPDHRSIRNIPVPPGRKRAAPAPAVAEEAEPRQAPQQSVGENRRGEARKRPTSLVLWIFAALVAAISVGFLIASLFEGATVLVHPKREGFSVDAELRVLPAAEAAVTDVPYQVMTLARTVTRTIPSTQEQRVERRAEGTITVYNAYNTASQRLIKNTRFEAPDGKIYRIDESVVIPGATRNADGTLAPGSIDVVVYADSPGPEYNKTGETVFTIPGFKGDPRYEKFSARSKTPLAGGFIGIEKVVPESELTRAREEMKQELENALPRAFAEEVPAEFMLVPDSVTLSFTDAPRESGEGVAIVGLTAEGHQAMVRERDLASFLARSNISEYEGEAVLFGQRGDVVLTLTQKPERLGESPLGLRISGEIALVWQYDAEGLKAELAGKERDAFEGVIRGYRPEITKAEASIRPFFNSSFPEEPSNITVETAPAQ